MRAKTLILQLPNQSKGTMDVMNDHSGGNLGALTGDGKFSLQLWDMDLYTSTVRWIVRNRIVPRCTYPYCRKLKGLFHHSSKCQTCVNGGCQYCRKIWHIIHLHAQFCAEPECHASRCKDSKEHLGKRQLREDSRQWQEDSRRRAGAKERMKERIRRKKRAEAREASD